MKLGEKSDVKYCDSKYRYNVRLFGSLSLTNVYILMQHIIKYVQKYIFFHFLRVIKWIFPRKHLKDEFLICIH